MNKLLTLGLVCIVTAGVVWHQRNSLAVVRADVRRLAAEMEAVSGSLELAQKEGARRERELAEEQTKAKGLRQNLAEWDVQAEAAVELPRSLGPGQCWPASEPFCYLPKSTLTRLGYMTFNIDGHLTDEAALLFGMSRTERARVEDSYATFSQELQALDLAHIRPVRTTGHFKDESEFVRQSYGVEVPVEQTAALQEEFNAAVHQVLAGDRGDLFGEVNQRFLKEWCEDLIAGPLRVTTFTSTKTPEKGYARLLVEYKVRNLDSDRPEGCKLFYPNDNTALGFQRFAALVRKYGEQSGR
jgi:hypothetical protein